MQKLRLKSLELIVFSFLMLAASLGLADVRNLAVGKTAATNSQMQTPARAVDQNSGTRWESQHGVDAVWLSVDLGKRYALQQVEIDWETANAKDYVVQGSTDNQSWVNLGSKEGASSGTRTDSFSVSGQYRYVRMNASARSTQWGYSIWEFKVLGDDVSTTPAGILDVAGASSSAAVQPASRAFDGNRNSRWESEHGVATANLTADLGASYDVSKVVLVWEAANAKEYVIQGSQNGSSWTNLAEFNGGEFGSRTDTLNIAGSYRYIRMQGNARSDGNFWGYSLWEMEIHGAGGGGDNGGGNGGVSDSDGDGVEDGFDQCPGTPAGTVVDNRGCKVESDYPTKILFIGNSFTEYGPIPELVEQMAHYAGFTNVDIQRRTLLGQSLTVHRNDADANGAPARIMEGWDAIVLQDQSTRPTDSGNPQAFYDDATWFNDRIKSVNPGAQVYLYETWAWRFDKDIYPSRFADPTQMQAEIRYHYNYAATNYIPAHSQYPNTPPVAVVPVGDAWELDLRNGEADGRLHDSDSHHAGNLGKYLNALVFYSVMFDRSATGMLPLLGLSQSQAQHLQSIANQVTGH